MVCQMAPLNDRYEDDNKYREIDNQLNTLTSDELTGLDDYFSNKLNEELLSTNVDQNENYMDRLGQIRSMNRYKECVQNLLSRTGLGLLDRESEQRICHRYLKQNRKTKLIPFLPF
jgi:hypothetical protein